MTIKHAFHLVVQIWNPEKIQVQQHGNRMVAGIAAVLVAESAQLVAVAS